MKIYFETYGCTSNQADTEIMEGIAKEKGHEIVEDQENADMVVLNTCIVIHTTEQRMESRIEDLEDRKLVVSGCLPAVKPEKAKELGADKVMTPQQVGDFERILEGEEPEEKEKWEKPICKERMIGKVPIAEGCTGNCSYCITKKTRGKVQSASINQVKERVKQLVEKGAKEIQLTAQDTAAYGIDIGKDLPTLLEEVCSVEGDFKIRVGMMNPDNAEKILEDLIEAYRDDKIYKFLHLPVQTGSNKILDNMNRFYDVETFRKVANRFKDELDATLSTDIIAGFPGESKKDFQRTVDLLESVRPDIINITRYSKRPGTEAAEMDGLDTEVKKRRSEKLTKLRNRICKERRDKNVGETRKVLITKPGKKEGTVIGRDRFYNTVAVQEKVNLGEKVDVKITDSHWAYLIGKPG